MIGRIKIKIRSLLHLYPSRFDWFSAMLESEKYKILSNNEIPGCYAVRSRCVADIMQRKGFSISEGTAFNYLQNLNTVTAIKTKENSFTGSPCFGTTDSRWFDREKFSDTPFLVDKGVVLRLLSEIPASERRLSLAFQLFLDSLQYLAAVITIALAWLAYL